MKRDLPSYKYMPTFLNTKWQNIVVSENSTSINRYIEEVSKLGK